MYKRVILHVEDDANEAFFVQRAFQKEGLAFDLHRVVDGDRGLAYLQGLNPYEDRAAYPVPELILLDLKLPGRDGFDVLAWIRAQDAFKAIPVVILTSSDRPQDLMRAQALGATSYLNKSVSCQNIIELLKKFDGAA